MSRKTTILAVAAVLAGAGAFAAVSAQGHRGWSDRAGRHGGPQAEDPRDFRRGWLSREVTKEDYDGRVRERFARLDKNSDGFIDATELEAFGGERRAGMLDRFKGARGANGGEHGGGQRMLHRFDTNRDGRVTRDEVLAHVRKRFGEVDLNNDGRISDDDLPPLQRGQRAVERMARGEGGGNGRMGGAGHGLGFLGEVEAKDGAIALDAVLVAAGRMFDRFDRSKDGAIDTADFDALRKEMVDYRVKRFVHAHGADKDGKVSREQFFAKAAERFAERDVNGDGRLGRGEVGGRGRHHGGMDHPGLRGPHGDGGERPMRRGPGHDGAPGQPRP